MALDKPWLDEGVAVLATRVMGWTWDEREGAWKAEDRGYVIAGWNPFEEIEHAFDVVSKLSADGLPLQMKEQTEPFGWEPVYVARFGDCSGAQAKITEPARVLARAALEAAKEYYQ